MPEIPSQIILVVVALFAGVILLLAIIRLQRRRADDGTRSPLPDYNHVLAELRRHEADQAPPMKPPVGGRRSDDLGERRLQKQSKIELRTLTAGERHAYFNAWQRIQAQAGRAPELAVRQGLELADEVLQARGFFGDRPQGRVPSATLPSLEAVAVMADYSRVREIAERSARGAATTEELRQAVLVLQALFHHLLTVGTAPEEPRRYATG